MTSRAAVQCVCAGRHSVFFTSLQQRLWKSCSPDVLAASSVSSVWNLFSWNWFALTCLQQWGIVNKSTPVKSRRTIIRHTHLTLKLGCTKNFLYSKTKLNKTTPKSTTKKYSICILKRKSNVWLLSKHRNTDLYGDNWTQEKPHSYTHVAKNN